MNYLYYAVLLFRVALSCLSYGMNAMALALAMAGAAERRPSGREELVMTRILILILTLNARSLHHWVSPINWRRGRFVYVHCDWTATMSCRAFAVELKPMSPRRLANLRQAATLRSPTNISFSHPIHSKLICILILRSLPLLLPPVILLLLLYAGHSFSVFD